MQVGVMYSFVINMKSNKQHIAGIVFSCAYSLLKMDSLSEVLSKITQ